MEIKILTKPDLTQSIEQQISDLFKQLSPKKVQQSLEEILDENNSITLVYGCKDENIIGIASMCTYKVISGKKAWIEDVVVNSKYRGKGLGRKLMKKLIEIGEKQNLTEILLFTENHRKAAISLYTDLGFRIKESNIYSKKNLS